MSSKVIPQYWIVGAMWGGNSDNDALRDFLMRGYWYCWPIDQLRDNSPHTGNSVGAQQNRFLQIQEEDRIAIKKMDITSQEMEIRAIGIVKDVDHREWRIYVNWLPLELNRRVELKGCTASIHGPYQNDDPLIQKVFCI